MGANKYGSFGFPSMVNRASKKKSSRKRSNNNNPIIVRVVDTYSPLEGDSSKNYLIGTISGEQVTKDNIPTNRLISPIYPKDPYKTIIPLIGEFVQITRVITPNFPSGRWAYESPIALYGLTSINSNSSPSAYTSPTTPTPPKNYAQAFDGIINIVPEGDFELNYSSADSLKPSTFVEQGNIHPLLPFEGDVIYEGRWGNSIRFGSTTKPKNNWSTSGNNGDPILILKNGQDPNANNFGSEFIIENIKNDLSSIYLTSTQQLKDFTLANENFYSYQLGGKPTITPVPETPASYKNSQIALNSNRIVLNANSDSVLISGQKSVGISSNLSINMESKHMVFSGNDIRLGSVDAIHPILKGDKTVDMLKTILKELINISTSLKTITDWPGGAPTPNSVVLNAVNTALSTFENEYNNINKIKSNFVKTT
jgi:hypothetical protein